MPPSGRAGHALIINGVRNTLARRQRRERTRESKGAECVLDQSTTTATPSTRREGQDVPMKLVSVPENLLNDTEDNDEEDEIYASVLDWPISMSMMRRN